jgi:enamine deaminase RidA (YjgF/YER057c/UK114 family)
MTDHEFINPSDLGAPRGFSHGVLAAPGRLLFVAGQIGWTPAAGVVSPEFVPQFEQALTNVLAVVREAGGSPSHLVRLTIYVTDRLAYLNALREVGAAYRRVMGRHYPAMALLEVRGLVEASAMVEIEGTAVIP